jgi:hypothetical protein
MKMEDLAPKDGYNVPASHHAFMSSGLEKLELFQEEITDLEAILQDAAQIDGKDSAKKSARLISS